MCSNYSNLFSATVVFILNLFVALTAVADTVDLPDGSKLDLSQICPVCEMKIESSVTGPGAVVFKDGKVVGFDGPADLFRYLLSPEKYGYDPANIKNTYVTEHGTKKFVDAKQAFYVVGAELKAIMGPEAIPFANKADAEKFSSQNKGKKVAASSGITLDDLTVKKKSLRMEKDHKH
ncbi:MAG: nitrous oxide reductase accessory protein NosL [Desulfomonile tiedjei]|uniref:Nitrous oxide reductase accessory protein NosL n=1 Tax=Desulfomonile tiedjei TaxID=2358 RepID=A0A9D6Z5V3_9BACT|nr:nitrous oxide reductase accessory protein NosL [Desulfomonile tiedjei]